MDAEPITENNGEGPPRGRRSGPRGGRGGGGGPPKDMEAGRMQRTDVS